jgi:hypothetical protein
LNDVLLYFAIIVIGGVFFLPLHIIVVRWMGGRQLITSLNIVIGFSTAAAVAVGWLFLGPHFSSPGAASVALVGGAIGFATLAGLYSLLLPSSVDRSVSVHIVKLLYLVPRQRMTEQQLFDLYTHEDVLEKRFLDCLATGIIKREQGELVLTRHGARIAWLYMAVGEGLGMRLWYLDRLRKRKNPFPPRA